MFRACSSGARWWFDFRALRAKADTGVVAMTRETAPAPACAFVRAAAAAILEIKNTHTTCQLRVSLFSCRFILARAASMRLDDACAVVLLATRALRRWMQKSQNGDPFAVHTLRGRKCVASDAMRSTAAAHDAKRIGCATRTQKCSRTPSPRHMQDAIAATPPPDAGKKWPP